MLGKRELMRKNKYLIDRVVKQVDIITRIAIELFRHDSDNNVFTDSTFSDDALETIQRAANVKTKIAKIEKKKKAGSQSTDQ